MAECIENTAAALERDGFAVLRGLLDEPLMESLRLRADATLFRTSQAAREAVRSNGSLCHFGDNPEYADVMAEPRILAQLRALGATDPRWTGGYLISKPPGGPPLFWHQDWWGWDEPESYQPRGLQWFVMIYLTPTTPQNGCLRVIPGSHRHDHPLHHLAIAHARELAAFSDAGDRAYAEHPDSVAVPVQAGDVVIGDSRLIHGAYANKTTVERPLLTLWYMPDWSQLRPAIRARAMQGYRRVEFDIRSDAPRALCPEHWPAALAARVATVLPLDGPTAEPCAWNRVPHAARQRARAVTC